MNAPSRQFMLHTAMSQANNGVGGLLTVQFYEQHMPHSDLKNAIRQARIYLMDALDALSSYQAEIDAREAAKKVSA
jgi:hypothetical protein